MLLDARGRPIADNEDVWMVQMLHEWLQDSRVRHLILRRATLTPDQLLKLGQMLFLELKSRIQFSNDPRAPNYAIIERKLLKTRLLQILRDPVVRRSIARSISQKLGKWKDQRDNRRQLQTMREDLEVQLSAMQVEKKIWTEGNC